MRKSPLCLDLGEPSFAPPSGMADFVCREISRCGGNVGYSGPHGELRLRKAICKWRERWHDDPIDHETVVVTVGASGAIAAIFPALVENLREIWLPRISYPTYRHLAAHLSSYPVRFYDPDLDGLWSCARSVDEGSGVVLVSPQNPQGDILGGSASAAAVTYMKEKGCTVVLDASFEDIVYDDSSGSLRRTVDAVSRLADMTLHSFSKTFSLSGWRVGYMVARNEEWRRKIMLSSWEQFLSAPLVSQWAALYCLAVDYQEYIDPILIELRRRRDWALGMLPAPAVVLKPVSGYFLWLRGPAGISQDLLSRSGVVTVSGPAFGGTDKHFRVNLAAPLPNVELGLKAVGDALTARPQPGW
jgi:aspartate/methionine/tyrosine aminotransferase